MNFGSYDDIESLMQQRPVYYAKIRRRSILIEAREVFGPLQSESQLEKGLKKNIATARGAGGLAVGRIYWSTSSGDVFRAY